LCSLWYPESPCLCIQIPPPSLSNPLASHQISWVRDTPSYIWKECGLPTPYRSKINVASRFWLTSSAFSNSSC
jgi:hypothetical protein